MQFCANSASPRLIAAAAPWRNELAAGWIAHYAVGILYAGILVLLAGPGWTREPTFLPAWILGMVTIGAGWFLLQPGMGGLLSTAGNLVFGGTEEGNFFALDAENGKPLWDIQLGGAVHANPISFGIDGKQYIAIASGLWRNAKNKLTRSPELKTHSQATMIFVFGL